MRRPPRLLPSRWEWRCKACGESGRAHRGCDRPRFHWSCRHSKPHPKLKSFGNRIFPEFHGVAIWGREWASVAMMSMLLSEQSFAICDMDYGPDQVRAASNRLHLHANPRLTGRRYRRWASEQLADDRRKFNRRE